MLTSCALKLMQSAGVSFSFQVLSGRSGAVSPGTGIRFPLDSDLYYRYHVIDNIVELMGIKS